ncbi:DUF6318 family protein [Paenarthrobacter sp. NPDC089322]|uniref:DUF6318 family protein n=1 Tax=Paenarthrobacter sp. NPDC089322 TaxID=3155065 RepID=UPI003413C172
MRGFAVGVAALLVLSGCQGGGWQGGTPSGTATETGSTTASPTLSATGTPVPVSSASAVYKPADANGKAENVPVPVMPELAKENSKEGLEAFIRYWYAQLSYSYETGYTESLRSIFSPTCALCRALTEGIQNGWAVEQLSRDGLGRSRVPSSFHLASSEDRARPRSETRILNVPPPSYPHLQLRRPSNRLELYNPWARRECKPWTCRLPDAPGRTLCHRWSTCRKSSHPWHRSGVR